MTDPQIAHQAARDEEAAAQWERDYRDLLTALFNAKHGDDANTIARLAGSYRAVAAGWRKLATDPAVPLWAQLAACAAAEDFERRAQAEQVRLTWVTPRTKRGM